jgi:hypothetical protein
LDTPLSADQDGNELTLADVLEAGEDIYEKHTDMEGLRAVLAEFGKTASPRDIQIIRMRFMEDKTQRETAEALNIAQSYVSRLENKVLRKIRKTAVKIGFMDANIPKPKKGETKTVGYREIDECKLKWLFENTVLNNSEIARIMGCAILTVSKYRKKFENGKMYRAADESAKALYERYLNTLNKEQTRQLQRRIEKRREADRTAPSEVKVYSIAELQKTPQKTPQEDAQSATAPPQPGVYAAEVACASPVTLDKPVNPVPLEQALTAKQEIKQGEQESQFSSEERKPKSMSFTLQGADYDNICDLLEFFVKQLERGKTYCFEVAATEE